MDTLFTIWLGLYGLVLGSFLNVVIARLPAGESVVRPRSRCPKCGTQLSWQENVPVLSWLVLRGRCRTCRAPISPRYPLVELLTGVLFLACLQRFGWGWPLVAALTFVTVLIPLVFIDAEHWVLPFELTLPGLVALLLLQLPLGLDAVRASAVGAVVAFLAFRTMELVGWLAFRREALGAGDKYLLALVGAALGPRSLLGVIFLSSVQGAVYALVRLGLTGRAAPPLGGVEQADPAPDSADRAPWTPAFLRPGLPVWRRVLYVPYALLLQDIPDAPPPDESGDEPVWVPSASSLPFGPWIGLAGLEVLLLGPWVASSLRGTAWGVVAPLLFGGG